MASQAASLIAEIQARFPGALLKGNGRGRKHLDFSLPDGRSVYVTEIADLHFQDGLGQWQEVDEGLVDDGADGFAKKCDRTRHAFRVGNGGTRRWYPRREVQTEYVDITAIQYWRTQGAGSWRNVAMPAAVWKQQGAEWDMPNLYASITNTWRRVKADFILKDSTAPTRLRFAVTLVGLTLGADWHLTSTTDATDVGSIDPPTAEDANESPVPVSATYAGGYIEWAADTSAVAFPVTVDPTFTDGYGGDVDTAKDTYVDSADTDRSFGALSLMIQAATQKSLIEFDLSSIAATATCDSATYYEYRNAAGTALAYTRTLYSIASGNADWIEGTSLDPATDNSPTWDFKAQTGTGTGTAWAGTAGLATAGTDYESSALGSYTGDKADAAGTEYTAALTTSRVAGWFGASNTNYGLLILTSANPGTIASSDHATTGYRPKLVVVYTAAGGVTARPWRKALLGVQW